MAAERAPGRLDGMPAVGSETVFRQFTTPVLVDQRLLGDVVDCWVAVSDAGGAVGFSFLPVDRDLVAAARLGEHRVRLADAGRRTEVHAQRAPAPAVRSAGVRSGRVGSDVVGSDGVRFDGARSGRAARSPGVPGPGRHPPSLLDRAVRHALGPPDRAFATVRRVRRGELLWWIGAVAVALATVADAVTQPPGLSLPAIRAISVPLLAVILAAGPVITAAAVAWARRGNHSAPSPTAPATPAPTAPAAQAAGAALMLVGTGLLVTGAVALLGGGIIGAELAAALGWAMLAQLVSLHVPFALVAAGVPYLLAGLGLWDGRAGRLRGAAVIAALLDLAIAANLASFVTWLSHMRGPSISVASLVLVAALVGAAVLQLTGRRSGVLLLRPPAPVADPVLTPVPGQAPGRTHDPVPDPGPDPGPSDGRRRRDRLIAIGTPAAAVLVVLGALTWPAWWPGQTISAIFPDPGLARCVATTLHVGPGDAVSSDDLASIRTLGCHATTPGTFPIHDLTGMERLPTLVALNLADNAVSDLTPLRRLPHPDKLFTLRLTNNQVRDLSPLSVLTGINDLGLSHNQISDLGPLRPLTGVRQLGLAYNLVTDLSPLAGMAGLTQLDAGHNQVHDIAVVARFPQLERLTLTGNRITDVAAVADLAHLSRLDVALNQVTDITPLGRMRTVEELWLGGNPLRDLTPLLAIRSLTGVDLHETDARTLIGVDQLRRRGVYVGGLA